VGDGNVKKCLDLERFYVPGGKKYGSPWNSVGDGESALSPPNFFFCPQENPERPGFSCLENERAAARPLKNHFSAPPCQERRKEFPPCGSDTDGIDFQKDEKTKGNDRKKPWGIKG